MPKLKVSDDEKGRRLVRAQIAGGQAREDYTDSEMATLLGISLSTYKSKKSDPGRFTLKEIAAIGRVLKFTPFQWASIGLGRELTAKEIKEFILF